SSVSTQRFSCVCASGAWIAFSILWRYQVTSMSKRSDQLLLAPKPGLHTKPSMPLSEVSGSSSGLPPVLTEICELACSAPGGTPSCAQLAGLPLGGEPSRPIRQGSSICASKRLREPNSSPMDGARKPSAKLPRRTNPLPNCQRKPNLPVVSPPKVE